MLEEFITKKGFAKLQAELTALKTTRRAEVAERLREALSFGDISENPEYIQAKEEQAFVEGRIAEIENILRSTMLIEDTFAKSTIMKAGIGCVVELASGGRIKKFTIVGKGEGDPLCGEISSDSPLGQALLGRCSGDFIKVSTPSGNKRYRIVRIA